jgi:cellulose biosynthesis protein BcsQ
MTPDIALAASAREWPDRLHRHLLDHGGGRVISRVLGADHAIQAEFEVLFIDDVCSFLSPGLVATLRAAGAEVIGVFDSSDGSDAKRRLLECGISDVVESDAEADEMVRVAHSALAHRAPIVDHNAAPDHLGWTVAFTGATAGVGATELGIGLASSAAARVDVALVDLDPHWPSVAPRLDLPLHPNVRTAIDFVLHQPNQLPRALQQVGALSVVGGVADRGAASPVGHVEAGMLLERLAAGSDLVVVDLGPFDQALRHLVSRVDTVAVVGTGDPVGITRLFRTLETIVDILGGRNLLVIANKIPGRPFHMAEVRAEIATAWPDLPVLTIPFDAGLAEAIWEGRPSIRGPFAKAIGRVASFVTERVGG